MNDNKTNTNVARYSVKALESAPLAILAKMAAGHGIKVKSGSHAAHVKALAAVTKSPVTAAVTAANDLPVTVQECHAAHCAANQLMVRFSADRDTATLRKAISSPKFNNKPVGKSKRVRNWTPDTIDAVVAFCAHKYGYLPV